MEIQTGPQIVSRTVKGKYGTGDHMLSLRMIESRAEARPGAEIIKWLVPACSCPFEKILA